MSRWLEVKQIKGEFYISSADFSKVVKEYKDKIYDLEQENQTLREEKAELKSELSKFSEAYKKYRDYEKEELAESCYDLARENEKLKEDTEHTIKFNNKIIGKLKLENDKLKADYIKLSKIVETTGGYKASYVNELRDKIAKLEFDIDALKKLKYGQEEEIIIPIYDEEGKLVMKH